MSQPNEHRTLKQGTLNCPDDKEPLHFEVMGMMRVKRRTDDDKWIYNARCPICKRHYEVQAPKEPK